MNHSIYEGFIDELHTNVQNNYQSVANIFEHEYGWPQIDPVRSEICKCIICGLHQAAIALTNHILESALKKALIIEESINNKNDKSNINDIFEDATIKYANKDLDYTINQTCSKGLISKEEKKVLHKFREQFRNSFSHADPQKTFSSISIPSIIATTEDLDSSGDFMKNIFQAKPNVRLLAKNNIIIQGLVQSIIAEQESLYYFQSVDGIIRNMCSKLFDSERYNVHKA